MEFENLQEVMYDMKMVNRGFAKNILKSKSPLKLNTPTLQNKKQTAVINISSLHLFWLRLSDVSYVTLHTTVKI